MLHSQSKDKEGVIVLHGLCRRASSMEPMARYLREAGYQVINVDYPSRKGTVEELSEKTLSQALQREELRFCSCVHYVTHSMGGILVRDYYHRHSAGNLGRVVMLGPPNQGSEVVDRIGHWKIFKWVNGLAGRELGTKKGSVLSRIGPVSFELGVIAGDRSINRINSLMIVGPDDGKVSVENTKVEGMKDHITVHVSHPYLMKRKQVQNLTVQFLRQGFFSPSSEH